MTPFSLGFSDELVKLANIIEKHLPTTAGYRSDTKHFGAPDAGGPQGSGGDLLGPDGKMQPDHETPGDEPNPVKIANDPIQKRVTVGGMKVSVEWPKGSNRKYMDKRDPTKVNYEKLMKADYGYIPGTKDNDGEQLDVYVGPNKKSDKVFVVRQLKDDGSFDENKVCLGYDSLEDAKKSYLDHMPPKRLGKITETTVDAFKEEHLARSREKFKKAAADLGVPGKVPRDIRDGVIGLFTAKAKRAARVIPEGNVCDACTAADDVDEPSPSSSGAESHF